MIKVLIIDDSALVRQMLTTILNSAAGITVVGTAQDPLIAREKIKQLNPDVLTLDVEMPRMDGLTFLGNLMRLRPMPVVMVSSLTSKGASVTLEALELGAVDFVSKPSALGRGLEEYSDEIIAKVRMAAGARVRAKAHTPARSAATATVAPSNTADAILAKKVGRSHFRTTERIIALGASTGGTEATAQVLKSLPSGFPAIVISQHLPAAFSASYTQRLDGCCQMKVKLAEHGEQIIPGHVYMAPGDHHLLVKRDGARYICHINDGPPVNRHRPSVDVMFRSVAQNVGPNALGVILTGMGADGAEGMKEMRDAGAFTIAQDEATSVVWGMPGSAYKLGAVSELLPLDKIAGALMSNLD
ncbi:chemotaxis response regulator protein-glutamate methylesterase [Mariprofundus erugo]|uniref:Protein-glutamate methylesterase/protein-glutamine glutaminase n=1 Tax=Mariprofundus erugo TaxID=2528639 RepID=A0A5R9GJ99_9PROT|nr:chemotaxis response regulator protein-glutamate methylesterase [Mariprofundus erugo]TLS66290.1 chemotaxis response regulator protein-glutamate methylesterase [Mariprofundus erugo]TLS78221.1 chemotaxis response regulator protein-glutamate methylesterase [Mariprofundus erugo]